MKYTSLNIVRYKFIIYKKRTFKNNSIEFKGN